jgi:hypothetical protein
MESFHISNRARTREPLARNASLELRNCGDGYARRRQRRDLGGVANSARIDRHIVQPPALPGPGGMPLIGTFPDAASPAIRANEAVGTASRTTARTILAEALDMMRFFFLESIGMRKVHVSPAIRRRR